MKTKQNTAAPQNDGVRPLADRQASLRGRPKEGRGNLNVRDRLPARMKIRSDGLHPEFSGFAMTPFERDLKRRGDENYCGKSGITGEYSHNFVAGTIFVFCVMLTVMVILF